MALLTSHPIPTEAVQHTESNVCANVDNSEVGTGTLFVTENYVVWLNANNEGLQLEYKQITLHAVSRDLQAFPKEHLLVHYEGKLPGMTNQGTESEESDGGGMQENESDCTLIEIKFVPDNKEALDPMFEAIAQCQTLHPDDDCQLSDDEFEDAVEENGAGDGFFQDEHGFEHLTEEGRQNLERFNQMLQAGQGDAEITRRTDQLNLSNGHHNADEEGQFQDADGAMEED